MGPVWQGSMALGVLHERIWNPWFPKHTLGRQTVRNMWERIRQSLTTLNLLGEINEREKVEYRRNTNT
jgi:hypothetical protein